MRKFIAITGVLAATFIATSAQACPDWQSSGREQLGTLTGTHLFTPRQWDVQAGGTTDLASCPQPGNGWVISDPDFEFELQNDGGYGRLAISATGDCDTVLLVNDPNGTWHFNDDADGVDPQVDVAGAPSGTYDIWVGTYGSETCPAQLQLETWSS